MQIGKNHTLPEAQKVLLVLLITVAAGYFLLSDLMGGTLFQHEGWDSYTLQTYNWLRGRNYIEGGERYSWLELAIYEGRYYVSFPPLPSVLLIPLVLLFGLNTPNNLLMAGYGLVSVALAYSIMLRAGRRPKTAAFWALVCVWGCNIMWMSTNGGVWFQAQVLNMLLCLAAVRCAQDRRRALSCTFLALAVGCRPLSAVYLPVFALSFAWEDRKQYPSFLRSLLAQWKCLPGPLLLAAAYMTYNFVRFHNPLEFGHNYLPEFTRTEYGQFHISYFWPNLRRLLTEPIRFSSGQLDIPLFNGFAFYLANPLFLLYLVRLFQSIRRKTITAEDVLLSLGMLVQLLATCMHRTLGSWQFGARYTCDLIAFAYFFLARRGPRKITCWELAIGSLAVVFNVYGAMHMYFLR